MAGNIRCKKIIVCCDGTAHSAIRGNDLNPYTNVLRLSRCIKSRDSDGRPQVVKYISGIGTSDGNLFNTYLQGTGIGIDEKIKEAYNFICHNYEDYDTAEEKDEIFLIGFSRGAFVARCVADLIGRVGILTKMGTHYLPYIYKSWKRNREPYPQPPQDAATPIASIAAGTSPGALFPAYFDENYVNVTPGNEVSSPPSLPSRSNMDTPGAGTPSSKMDSYRKTENERDRKQFQQDQHSILTNKLYVRRDVHVKVCAVWDTVASIGLVSTHLSIFRRWKSRKLNFVASDLCDGIDHAIQALSFHEHRHPFRPIVWKLPEDSEKNRNDKPRLQQCWFMGYHADIGGGIRGEGLSHYPLAWMMSKLEGFLEFDDSNFWNPRPVEMRWKIHGPKDPWSSDPTIKIDVKDSMSKRYLLAGSHYREPKQQFWLPEPRINSLQDKYESCEAVHFTVHLLHNRGAIELPKAMKDAKFEQGKWNLRFLPPRSYWHRLQNAWGKADTTQTKEFVIEEDNMSSFEISLLKKWVRGELGVFLDEHDDRDENLDENDGYDNGADIGAGDGIGGGGHHFDALQYGIQSFLTGLLAHLLLHELRHSPNHWGPLGDVGNRSGIDVA